MRIWDVPINLLLTILSIWSDAYTFVEEKEVELLLEYKC